MISLMYGHVRVAAADNWSDARVILREQISLFYGSMYRTEASMREEAAELARCDSEPLTGILITSGDHAWADTRRMAIEGHYGIGTGDLAFVHEYTNGHMSCWTIDVKCKVLTISPTHVTVRITGESCQFRRGQVVTIRLSYLRKRS
jgi:hypothetical protein